MGQTIFGPVPSIPLPIPQASAWTLRVPVDRKIRAADLLALVHDVDGLVGGIDDGQWWIESAGGQIFSARGTQALNQVLSNPPFTVVGLEFAKHAHPGFPQAHAAGQPHPQTPTVRLARVDLRSERAITLESDDATWVAGARVVLAGRVQGLSSTQLWRRRTTLLAPLIPTTLLGAIAYRLADGALASASDVASAVGVAAGIGFVLGGQILEYLRRKTPAAFGGTHISPWLEASWAMGANFVATIIALVAAVSRHIR